MSHLCLRVILKTFNFPGRSLHKRQTRQIRFYLLGYSLPLSRFLWYSNLKCSINVHVSGSLLGGTYMWDSLLHPNLNQVNLRQAPPFARTSYDKPSWRYLFMSAISQFKRILGCSSRTIDYYTDMFVNLADWCGHSRAQRMELIRSYYCSPPRTLETVILIVLQLY